MNSEYHHQRRNTVEERIEDIWMNVSISKFIPKPNSLTIRECNLSDSFYATFKMFPDGLMGNGLYLSRSIPMEACIKSIEFSGSPGRNV